MTTKRTVILIGAAALLLVLVGVFLLRQVMAPGNAVPWSLQGMGGGGAIGSSPPLAPVAETTTSVNVFVPYWPLHEPSGESWLTPSVSYSSDSVTITLRTSTAYEAMPKDPRIGMYDTGGWVTVQLSEPLHGRSLLDGSTWPAEVRPDH